MTEIKLAETAGFCFGVNRAVELVYKLLGEGKKVCTLGPIIHNAQLVDELTKRGVVIVDTPDEVPDGYTLVVRSHGIAKDIHEQIKSREILCSDATCPFVSKIHKIVEKNTSHEIPLFIAGDPKHAEVIGIMGYANGPIYVFKDTDELENITNQHPEFTEMQVCVVAQTTFQAEIWKKSEKFLKKHYTNAKIFDTICDATAERQNEATKLSKESDFMVVIGGRHSSNTRKLFDICSCNTKTVLVESADELCSEDFKNSRLIGVTAGASTPAGIIKEVLKTMSETIKTEDTMAVETAEIEQAAEKATTPDDAAATQAAKEEVVKSFDDMTFEEALEASLNGMNTNQKVKGLVVAVTPTEVQVDIGRKYTGYVPANELSSDPNEKPEDVVKVGDTIDLIVMRTNDQEGIITLSKRRFDADKGFDIVASAAESGEILEGKVTAVVKGGITMSCNGCRVFVPASHATLSRGEELEPLVGTTQQFKVLEIGRGRRVVGSIRQILRDQKKAENEALWASLAVGNTYTGTVKSLTSYGVFVDIGGADGMVHISELSWKRVKHPSEVVSVGDEIEVFIKDIDFEKHKISLGYKKEEDNPWFILKSKYNVGDVATVKVVSMTTYGAFANLIPGIDGLIHISQIADRRIEKPQDVLTVGDEVQVKITEIDYDKKRVSLSIRALIEPKQEEKVEEVVEEETSSVLYSTEAPGEVPEALVEETEE